MTSFNKRVQQMIRQVLVFGEAHPELFEKESLNGRRLAELAAVAERLETQAQSQIQGQRVATISAADRTDARTGLRSQMEAISRAAKAVDISGFWMPRGRGDETLVSVARTWPDEAELHKDLLLKANLPADFIEQLKAATDTVQAVIQEQRAHQLKRMKATEEVNKVRAEAMAIVQKIDPLVENMLAPDSTLRKIWTTLRRIPRSSRAKGAEVTAEAPAEAVAPAPGSTDPPATRAGAAAA